MSTKPKTNEDKSGKYIIDNWEVDYSVSGVVIGLEIHLQLNQLKTKLFCSCDSEYRGKEPNTHCCPVCMGLPGVLPKINNSAVDFATTLAISLEADISEKQFFHRKNYYYPDMPKNYQTTQYNRGGGVPFANGGKITIKTQQGNSREIQMDRMHLEDDPGKLVHIGTFVTSPYTKVDYNRCGTTLIEMVTKPEIYDAEEARAFLNKLRAIISHIGISDIAKDGSFRVDVNISFENQKRCEIKNIGSVRDVEKAIRWEIMRQKLLIKQGKMINQETRAWNGKQTILLRTKEQEDDYRYFPEPDLVPFNVTTDRINKRKKLLPELPDARIKRFMKEFNLSEYDSNVLVTDKYSADFFEKCTKKSNHYKIILNWLNNVILGYLNDNNISLKDTKLTPDLLVEIIKLVENNTVSIKIAKELLPEIMQGKKPTQLVKEQGVEKIIDSAILEPMCDKVIETSEAIIKSIEKKPKAFMALVGQIMKETKGRADSDLVQKIFAKKIGFDLSKLL